MRGVITALVLVAFGLFCQGQFASAQGRARQEAQTERPPHPLKDQLNEIIQTRDSSRGLTANIPDLFFDTGKATPTIVAQERLAKAAEILAGHPGIHVEVNGYTDNAGEAGSQQELSQERAGTVKSILVQRGVPAAAISVHGFGGANPVASNDTAAGRQQNRRVELVVSGESIGNQTALSR